jgi:hypothetical protein
LESIGGLKSLQQLVCPLEAYAAALNPWLRQGGSGDHSDANILPFGDHGKGASVLERLDPVEGVVDAACGTIFKPQLAPIGVDDPGAPQGVVVAAGAEVGDLRGGAVDGIVLGTVVGAVGHAGC